MYACCSNLSAIVTVQHGHNTKSQKCTCKLNTCRQYDTTLQDDSAGLRVTIFMILHVFVKQYSPNKHSLGPVQYHLAQQFQKVKNYRYKHYKYEKRTIKVTETIKSETGGLNQITSSTFFFFFVKHNISRLKSNRETRKLTL